MKIHGLLNSILYIIYVYIVLRASSQGLCKLMPPFLVVLHLTRSYYRLHAVNIENIIDREAVHFSSFFLFYFCPLNQLLIIRATMKSARIHIFHSLSTRKKKRIKLTKKYYKSFSYSMNYCHF